MKKHEWVITKKAHITATGDIFPFETQVCGICGVDEYNTLLYSGLEILEINWNDCDLMVLKKIMDL